MDSTCTFRQLSMLASKHVFMIRKWNIYDHIITQLK